MIMGDIANFLHGFFKHAVGGGVCDHASGEIGAVQFRLGAEICHVDVAVCVRMNHHNLIPNHLCRGRVCAMGRCGDQADIAVPFVLARVIFPNGQKPCIFSLRP